MSNDFSAERMSDRAEIQHRIYQFCRAVDRLEFGLLHEVYHPGAIHDHGVYKGDLDGWIKFTQRRHETIGYSSHHVGNTIIEFADDDNAAVETYFLVWQSVTAKSSPFPSDSEGTADYEVLLSGRYLDHFVRKDGRWGIMARTAVAETVLKMTEPAPTFAAGLSHQTRDASDPMWLLRSRVGVA